MNRAICSNIIFILYRAQHFVRRTRLSFNLSCIYLWQLTAWCPQYTRYTRLYATSCENGVFFQCGNLQRKAKRIRYRFGACRREWAWQPIAYDEAQYDTSEENAVITTIIICIDTISKMRFFCASTAAGAPYPAFLSYFASLYYTKCAFCIIESWFIGGLMCAPCCCFFCKNTVPP